MSHYGLDRLISELEHLAPRYPEQKQMVAAVVGSMQKLLSNPQIFEPQFVDAVVQGHHDGRVYTSSDHGFFIQLFAWPPGAETPVHDHNTWGVMGILQNELAVTEYQMIPQAQAGHFNLEAKPSYTAGRGAIVYVLSPEDEIHQIVNPTQEYSFSIHIYGQELTQTSVFDLENGRVYPA